MAKRIFFKDEYNSNNDNPQKTVIFIDEEDIDKGTRFYNDLWFGVRPEDIDDITKYRDFEGIFVSESDLEDHIIFNSNDGLDKRFVNLIKEYKDCCKTFDQAIMKVEYEEDIISKSEVQQQLNYIRNYFETAINWCEADEYYTYWDGSNHQELLLSGEHSEWIDITNDEDFVNVYESSWENRGTYEERIIRTKSDSVYLVINSFYQGCIGYIYELLSGEEAECETPDELNELRRDKW